MPMSGGGMCAASGTLDVYASQVDHWMLYYNGGVDLTLVAHGNGKVVVLSQERFDAFKEDVCLK